MNGKYISVEWPEIQEYMSDDIDFKEVGYDPEKDIWFVPEDIYISVQKRVVTEDYERT